MGNQITKEHKNGYS